MKDNINMDIAIGVKPTCVNCKHYHSTMSDLSNTDFHFHDYCDIWEAKIPDYTLFMRNGCEVGYGDIECGLASCWCFEIKDNGDYIDKFPNLGEDD